MKYDSTTPPPKVRNPTQLAPTIEPTITPIARAKKQKVKNTPMKPPFTPKNDIGRSRAL